jgi:hypothetical protein
MSALVFRRAALVAAPVIAAVLIVAGVFLDPDIDASGRELAEEYAENPGVTQLSALSFHFAFVMWAPLVFALAGLIRGRGVWLANVAAILAVLGATTLPGFLVVDFYDIAIVDELGADAWQPVTDRIEELPGATVLFVTGFLGHVLCLPVVLLAAWRARLLPFWTFAVVTAGLLAGQAVSPFGSGLLLAALAMLALAYSLSRLDWRPGGARAT